MKANELRIGNLVTLNNERYHPRVHGETLMVTGINQTRGFENEKTHGVSLEHINQKKTTYYDTYSQFICYVEPIALTEEWLLKFGFEKSSDNGYIIELSYNSHLDIDFVYNYSELSVSKYAMNLNVKYVHQLQNLYFALKGEELDIKL